MMKRFTLLLSIGLLWLVSSTTWMQEEDDTLPLLSEGQHVAIIYGESTPDAAEYLNSSYFEAVQAGVSGYELSFSWAELEPSPGEYDLATVEEYLGVTKMFNLTPFIVIRTIDTVSLNLPDDYTDDDLSFDDPEVLERFGAMLDQFVPLAVEYGAFAISVGNEVDSWLASNPDQVEPYVAFVEAARERIQAIEPGLRVSATLTYGGVVNEREIVDALLAVSDAAIFTYYPLEADFKVHEPDVVADDMALLVEVAGELPIIMQEVGYPSGYLPEVSNGSSQEMQAQFVTNIFAAMDVHPELRFVSFFQLGDWADTTCDTFLSYYGLDVPLFREYLCTLGLITHDGERKAGYDALIAGLEAQTD